MKDDESALEIGSIALNAFGYANDVLLEPARFDFEYERMGATNIFLFTEPLGGAKPTCAHEKRR